MIYSFEIEKNFLAGMMQMPNLYIDYATFVSDADFYSEDSKVNLTIYRVLKNMIENKTTPNAVIVIEKIKGLSMNFKDQIDSSDYINALERIPMNENKFLSTMKELKSISTRRNILNSAEKIKRIVKNPKPDENIMDLIRKSDEIYNKTMDFTDLEAVAPVDLFAIMEEVVEDRGENPVKDLGMMGPFPSINNMYGSILKEGNITVIVARSGVGKSSLALNYCSKVGYKYDVPVLHFDNGEMSQEELLFRLCAAMSGIPMNLIESGKWRNTSWTDFKGNVFAPDEVREKVRNVWKILKEGRLKFFYYNVAGMDADQMVSLMKRFYYGSVGRGNKMILSFDYLKPDFANIGSGQDWAFLGKMVDKFKQAIHKEIVYEGKQMVSMFTSVQANRSGIVTNKKSEDVNDDEGIVGLSDMITQFCSFMFILRKKTLDEIALHGRKFGNYVLKSLKNRHLGEDVDRALDPIDFPDGSKRSNWVNLEMRNFAFKDVGDGVDVKNEMIKGIRVKEGSVKNEQLPKNLQ